MSRGWLWALLISSVLLAVLVAAALLRELRQPWRATQARAGTSSPAGIVEIAGPLGPERCLSCHFALLDAVDDPAHAMLRAAHPMRVQGCVGCHGGDGRALDPAVAHRLDGRQRLVSSALRSSRCVRCHVPGSVAGTEPVVEGIAVYAELGCLTCHRLEGAARAADLQGGYGPDLDDAGRLDPGKLRQAMREPQLLFGADTGMPAFAAVLDARPELERALRSFLSSRRSDLPRPRARGDAGAACIGCHASAPARGLEQHRCAWIVRSASDWSCARCHQASWLAAPERGAATCLFIDGQRPVCGTCHASATGAVHGS